MSVVFQIHVGNNSPYSRKYDGSGGCSRAEAKRLLDEVAGEARRYHRALESSQDFQNGIDAAKRAVDNATGGASAASTRGFFNREITTSAGYVRIDIEIHRGNGHFRS